jgi:hypothetical protein
VQAGVARSVGGHVGRSVIDASDTSVFRPKRPSLRADRALVGLADSDLPGDDLVAHSGTYRANCTMPNPAYFL